MGERTTLRIPFAQGLGQQTSQEWQDPNATAYSVVNGNFTKSGALDKRLGMEFVGGQGQFLPLQGSPWVGPMSHGIQGAVWSKCAFGASGLDANGLAAVYSVLDNQSGNLALGPLPPCSVLRRGIPSATTASTVNTTPTIVDVPDGNDVRRFAFYVSGNAVWCVVTNTTGDLINAPLEIYSGGAPAVIQAVYRPAASAADAIAVLFWFPVTQTAVGLTVNATGTSFMTGPTISSVVAIDMCAFVGDPLGGYMVAAEVIVGGGVVGPVLAVEVLYYTGNWALQNTMTAESPSNVVGNGIVVSANFGSSELVAVVYEFTGVSTGLANVRYASFSGVGFGAVTTATPILAPYNAANGGQWQLSALTRTSAGTFLFVYFAPYVQFSPTYWANTMPFGFYGIISGGIYAQSGVLPLGAYPVAKPFVVGAIPYMPVVTQLNAAYSPGTSPINEPIEAYSASEQCTMYLLQFKLGIVGVETTAYALPVAAVAVRQVDPSFSFFTNGLTTPPPFCSSVSGTRFAVGLKTQAEDQVAGQQSLGAAWWAEFRFDAAEQSLLFQIDDVYGSGHIAGGVPFTCDGTQTYEDNFFVYPEFASCSIAPNGFAQTWGTYGYAVVYKHIDATGQITRGSPVFTNELANSYDTLSGSAILVQGSSEVTFSLAQSLSAGTMFQFSSQDGTYYFLQSQMTSATVGTLTTNYTGPGGGGATVQVAGNPFILTFPPLSMTWRDLANPGQVYAEIYRTTAGGGTFYLVAEVSAFPTFVQGGTITGVDPLVAGDGYASAPTVAIAAPSPGPGVTATATANLSGGQITAVTIAPGDMGEYTQGGWQVTFSGGGGTGAFGLAVLGPVPGQLYEGVASVAMISEGTGYTSTPTVVWTAGLPYGSGAVGAAVRTPLGVTSYTMTNVGSGYTSLPSVTLSGGGGGSGASAEAVLAVGSTTPNPITYTDVNTPDAAITSNSILYITGGVLDCVNPPSFYCQTLHWNRIWGVDETRRMIWFTKAFTMGETPGYNEADTITFPQDITGLWSLDDKLVIGTANGIFIVYGQGPADNGQGSDLTIPQPIACDSGPIDWRAGIVFPGGLIYRSQTGFMLCDRSLNVSWIGKDVVDLLTQYPTVLSAVTVPTATQLRFLCQAANGQTVVLVYDYLVQKWLQHSYLWASRGASLMLTGTTPQNPSSYAMLGADGAFWQEQQPSAAQAYMDETETGIFTFVSTNYTSAWFKIQGVNGYQRVTQVQVLFEEQDDAGIGMNFAFAGGHGGYTSGLAQAAAWTSLQIDEVAVPIVMQHVAAQYNKSMGIQVTVYDTEGTSATNGKGMRFVTLSLEMEKLGDTFRQIPAMGRA